MATNRCELPVRLQLPDGAELHYLSQGRGQPLVLLHGETGDCHAWAPQMHPLSARFRVIAYSRRLHRPNRSQPAPNHHTPQRDVDDLAALLHALRCGPAHLAGTGRGALLALQFALQRPRDTSSLALAEPSLLAWAGRTPDGRALLDAFLASAWHPAKLAFARGDNAPALQILVDGLWGERLFHRLAPERKDALLRNCEAIKALLNAADPFPDLSRAEVGALSMPVMLLEGDRATDLHRRVMDELALALPQAPRIVIAGAGHGAPSENPGGFNRALRWFLHDGRR
jgi:pimeloyl-ACP methyl ester carboxylesterase